MITNGTVRTRGILLLGIALFVLSLTGDINNLRGRHVPIPADGHLLYNFTMALERRSKKVKFDTTFGQSIDVEATYDPPWLCVGIELRANRFEKVAITMSSQQFEELVGKLNTIKDWCDTFPR